MVIYCRITMDDNHEPVNRNVKELSEYRQFYKPGGLID
jgi:hypothetical protein